MKRIAACLFAIFLTFAAGLTATLIYLNFKTNNIQRAAIPVNTLPVDGNAAAGLPALSFCEVSTDPQKYDGKIVRLSGVLVFGTEGVWFSASECAASKGTTLISFENEEAWKPINAAIKQKNKEFWERKINVTVIGEFKNEDPKSCCIKASSQFEISKVEKASKTN